MGTTNAIATPCNSKLLSFQDSGSESAAYTDISMCRIGTKPAAPANQSAFDVRGTLTTVAAYNAIAIASNV